MSKLCGCKGRLCRAFGRQSKRFNCVRYAADEFGIIDAEKAVASYKICGRISGKINRNSSNQIDIAGRNNGKYSVGLELLVIMSSGDILAGDVIFDGESRYRITEQLCDIPMKFGLERIEFDISEKISSEGDGA